MPVRKHTMKGMTISVKISNQSIALKLSKGEIVTNQQYSFQLFYEFQKVIAESKIDADDTL